jgi:hypothetical protein
MPQAQQVPELLPEPLDRCWGQLVHTRPTLPLRLTPHPSAKTFDAKLSDSS